MALMTVASYGRGHVSENARVVADTLFYSHNKISVADRSQASYYRLLMKQGKGLTSQDVFQDFYLDGTLKAEGGYSFMDLGNDNNTVVNGEVTTYYVNGKERMHGMFKDGKPEGYFTMMMRDGSIAVAEFVNGESKHDYFTVTNANGESERRPIEEIKSLLQ